MPNPKDSKGEIICMDTIVDTLRNADNEGTDSPYWVILDKLQLSSRKDVVGDKYYHGITGIFFSREDAESHLKNRRYAFSADAQVWCLSGYWSKKYKAFWKVIDQEKHYGKQHYPGCHKVHIECANKKISDARDIFRSQMAPSCICGKTDSDFCSDQRSRELQCPKWDMRKWLESLGEK